MNNLIQKKNLGIVNGRPVANNTRANMGISDKFSKASEMFTSSPFALRAGIIMLLIIIILIIVYLIVVYFSYQVKVQSLIPNDRIVDLSKMMDAEQYSVVNNTDNNFSLGFWLFTNGINNIDKAPFTLLRCTDGYLPNTPLDYEQTLTLEKYNTYKSDVIAKAMFNNEVFYDSEKIILGLYGNDLFMMLKPVTQQKDKDKYIYLTIDFLPLSSWNHIVLTVDGEFIIVYLNGEIYKTQSIKTLESYSRTTITSTTSATITKLDIGFNQIVLLPNATKTTTDPSEIENTYVTKLFFSDDLVSQKQVEQLYASTPYGSSFMSKIGYGLRSPVYRLDYDASGAV